MQVCGGGGEETHSHTLITLNITLYSYNSAYLSESLPLAASLSHTAVLDEDEARQGFISEAFITDSLTISRMQISMPVTIVNEDAAKVQQVPEPRDVA